MKNKILDALKPVYGKGSKMGLADDLLESVAASIAPFITNEEQIAGFVTAAEPMFKKTQSEADKVRTELYAKIRGLEGEKADLEAKLKDGNKPDPDKKDPPKDESQDMAKIIADAVAAAIKPISDELATFKGEQSAKAAFANAQATFKGNDYVKKYADEATDAWERATEMYEATGKKWTAEELGQKAMGYFNKAVAKKGVDTSKPFESDGGAENETLDTDEIKQALQSRGNLPKSE